MIIGITGKNGSGKGTVADFLKKRGFIYYSLSDVLREELKNQGKEVTRENLIKIGNKLREESGANVLADKICKKLHSDKNYIVDSIRNPFEVERLKKEKNFFLIKVTAPQKIRFLRCKERAREGAEITLKDFIEIEKRELKSNDKNAQQILKTEELADYEIDNSKTIESLEEQCISILKKTKKIKFEARPSWDQYFMDIAKVVSSRSNCIKRHVAAIIVKDRRIISTGYNGTPRGIKNCFEGGCKRCNSFGVSGEDLGECICSHAEENAITQAAYHGVAIKGATIYVTFSPCLMCTKMIINSGIVEVVYGEEYSINQLEFSLFKEASVKVRALKI